VEGSQKKGENKSLRLALEGEHRVDRTEITPAGEEEEKGRLYHCRGEKGLHLGVI